MSEFEDSDSAGDDGDEKEDKDGHEEEKEDEDEDDFKEAIHVNAEGLVTDPAKCYSPLAAEQLGRGEPRGRPAVQWSLRGGYHVEKSIVNSLHAQTGTAVKTFSDGEEHWLKPCKRCAPRFDAASTARAQRTRAWRAMKRTRPRKTR